MATVPEPKRHASSLFHRHHSDRHLFKSVSPEQAIKPRFEGTDAVEQNRKVALQRVVEVHDALELAHHNDLALAERPVSPNSISIDPFSIDFSAIPFPDAEVRSFEYFVRMWDPSATSDPEFDDAIHSSRPQFEEAAFKHFFRRVAQWNASEEMQKAAKEKLTKDTKRREKDKSLLGKLWVVEKEREGHTVKDGLKEVTTQEGLAQLLWTLLHDSKAPLTPKLLEECNMALKKKYGMKC